jgi:Fe2+ or Zn2+ uptake regulation protein
MKEGIFCEMFGTSVRNRVLEFLLEMRELDFGAGDIAEETGLSRASVYNMVECLLKEGYVVESRIVSGAQLYGLNKKEKKVKVLILVFNLLLKTFIEGKSLGDIKMDLVAKARR